MAEYTSHVYRYYFYASDFYAFNKDYRNCKVHECERRMRDGRYLCHYEYKFDGFQIAFILNSNRYVLEDDMFIMKTNKKLKEEHSIIFLREIKDFLQLVASGALRW